MDLHDEVALRYLAVRHAIPPIEWPVYAGDVAEILDRKRRMRAAILAHNYQDPVIFHGVADVTGDSLALAERARSLCQSNQPRSFATICPGRKANTPAR